MIETDKTKDSDLLAVMIYRSFVAPETLPTPPDMTFISFRDALDFYARTAAAESILDADKTLPHRLAKSIFETNS